MAHALLAFLLVISLAPGTGLAKTIRPQMNRVAHEFVARPTDVDFVDPARLIGYRGGPGDSLKHFMAAITIRIVAHGRQQAWG